MALQNRVSRHHRSNTISYFDVFVESAEFSLCFPFQTRRKELKDRVISNIEEGRRVMGLDLILRTASGEPATEANSGIISLYHKVQQQKPIDLFVQLFLLLIFFFFFFFVVFLQHKELASQDRGSPKESSDLIVVSSLPALFFFFFFFSARFSQRGVIFCSSFFLYHLHTEHVSAIHSEEPPQTEPRDRNWRCVFAHSLRFEDSHVLGTTLGLVVAVCFAVVAHTFRFLFSHAGAFRLESQRNFSSRCTAEPPTSLSLKSSALPSPLKACRTTSTVSEN
jgi:hypothetical protein